MEKKRRTKAKRRTGTVDAERGTSGERVVRSVMSLSHVRKFTKGLTGNQKTELTRIILAYC